MLVRVQPAVLDELPPEHPLTVGGLAALGIEVTLTGQQYCWLLTNALQRDSSVCLFRGSHSCVPAFLRR